MSALRKQIESQQNLPKGDQFLIINPTNSNNSILMFEAQDVKNVMEGKGGLNSMFKFKTGQDIKQAGSSTKSESTLKTSATSSNSTLLHLYSHKSFSNPCSNGDRSVVSPMVLSVECDTPKNTAITLIKHIKNAFGESLTLHDTEYRYKYSFTNKEGVVRQGEKSCTFHFTGTTEVFNYIKEDFIVNRLPEIASANFLSIAVAATKQIFEFQVQPKLSYRLEDKEYFNTALNSNYSDSNSNKNDTNRTDMKNAESKTINTNVLKTDSNVALAETPPRTDRGNNEHYNENKNYNGRPYNIVSAEIDAIMIQINDMKVELDASRERKDFVKFADCKTKLKNLEDQLTANKEELSAIPKSYDTVAAELAQLESEFGSLKVEQEDARGRRDYLKFTECKTKMKNLEELLAVKKEELSIIPKPRRRSSLCREIDAIWSADSPDLKKLNELNQMISDIDSMKPRRRSSLRREIDTIWSADSPDMTRLNDLTKLMNEIEDSPSMKKKKIDELELLPDSSIGNQCTLGETLNDAKPNTKKAKATAKAKAKV